LCIHSCSSYLMTPRTLILILLYSSVDPWYLHSFPTRRSSDLVFWDTDGRMPMRDFTGPLPGLVLPALRFERHAQVALLWTARDRRGDWLRDGQALERTLLEATAHGGHTSILPRATEWPDPRAAVAGARGRGSPHLLIRFGYGPEGARTPRVRTPRARPSAG